MTSLLVLLALCAFLAPAAAQDIPPPSDPRLHAKAASLIPPRGWNPCNGFQCVRRFGVCVAIARQRRSSRAVPPPPPP